MSTSAMMAEKSIDVSSSLRLIQNAIMQAKTSANFRQEAAENLLNQLLKDTKSPEILQNVLQTVLLMDIINGDRACDVSEEHPIKIDAKRLIGETYFDRIMGDRSMNMRLAFKHTSSVVDYYKQLLMSSTERLDRYQFAKCASNLGHCALCMREFDQPEELDSEIEEKAVANMQIALEHFNEHNDDFIFYNLIYNLNRMHRKPITELAIYLNSAAETGNPKFVSMVHHQIAIDALYNCLTANGVPDEAIDIERYRFGELMCREKFCAHNAATLAHIEEEIRISRASRLRDPTTISLLNMTSTREALNASDEIAAINLCAMYYATNHTLSDSDRHRLAKKASKEVVALIEQNWPLYNLHAQVEFVKTHGLVWENAIDVILSTPQPGDFLLELLSTIKAHNIASAMGQSEIEFSSIFDDEAYHNLSGLRRKTSDRGPSLRHYLHDHEVVIEWWFSIQKQFGVCLTYSKFKKPIVYHIFERTVASVIHPLAGELAALALSNAQFTHGLLETWQQLAQNLKLDDLPNFLKQNFPLATKYLLIGSGFLHFLPIHIMPLANSEFPTLLHAASDGIIFLPTSRFLLKRAETPAWNDGFKEHAYIFYADPKNDIPSAKLEFSTIADLFRRHAGVVQSYPNATKLQLENTLNNRSVTLLHIACHGQFSYEDSAQSYLRMSDGPLFLQDLRKTDLRQCQLAVLSACSVGVRDFQKAQLTEIFSGLGAQLLAAGCRNVLVALSPVSDKDTTELMQRFHGNLLTKELPPAKAFREAFLDSTVAESLSDPGGSTASRHLGISDHIVKRAKVDTNAILLPFQLIGLD